MNICNVEPLIAECPKLDIEVSYVLDRKLEERLNNLELDLDVF